MKRIISRLLRHPGLLGRICLVLAAMCSLYLASISLAQTPMLGCDADSSCYNVLSSRWAFLFGIPASFIAIAVYLVTVLAAGAFESREHRTWLGLLGEVCAMLITVAAVWFLAIQIFSLKQFCFWCCLTHLLSLGGVILLTFQRRSHPEPDETQQDWAEANVLRRNSLMGLTRIGAVAAGVAVLLVGPFIAVPEIPLSVVNTDSAQPLNDSSLAEGSGPRLLGFAQGKIVFKPTELPLMGNANAKEFAAVLTDYTCEYCRQYELVLEELVKKRGPDFAVVLLPAARDDNGSLIQHTMLCLFKADPAKHKTLAQQLITGTHPATAAAVRLSAQTLLGAEAWADAEKKNTSWATEQILATRKLHAANQAYANSTRLPQLMVGNQILIGFYDSVDRLNSFVETSLNPEMTTEQPVMTKAEPAPVAPLPEAVSPTLKPRFVVQDLGTFQPGQKRNCQVDFTNTGKDSLKIAWVGLDPGCELVKMPRDIIPPNGQSSISINVQAPESDEVFIRKINIHSNGQAPLVVSVQGRVAANPATPPISIKATVNRR